MPFVDSDTWNDFQGAQWQQSALGRVGDVWANNALATAPDRAAAAEQQAAQQQADQQAALQRAQEQAAQYAAQQAADAQRQAAEAAAQQAAAQQAAQDQAANQWAAKSYDQAATAATGVAPAPAPAPQPAPQVDVNGGATQTAAAVGPSTPLPSASSGNYVAYAWQAAQKAGIDPGIFTRQIQQESGFQPFEPDGSPKKSPAGAVGIAQIVPKFHPNVDPTNPLASLDYAAQYMATLLKQNGGDMAKALAAYNAGQGAVDRFGGVPPFAETQSYVNIIMNDVKGLGAQLAERAKEGLGAAGQAVQDITHGTSGDHPLGPPPVDNGHGGTGQVFQTPTGDWNIAFGFNQPYGAAQFNQNIPNHRGVDLTIPGAQNNGRGTPYTAFQPGTVVALTHDPAGGNGIIVQTADGLYNRYFHNDKVLVGVGDKVDQTTQIGVLGASGTEGFPHLHFEVSRGINGDPTNQLIDPRPYMMGGGGAQGAAGTQTAGTSTTTPAGQPGSRPAQPQAQTMAQFIQQYQSTQGRMPTDTELGNFVLSQPPEQTAASVGQPQPIQQSSSPFDVVGNIASGLGNVVSGAVGGVTGALGSLFGRGGPGGQPPGGPADLTPTASTSPFPGLPSLPGLPTDVVPEGGGFGAVPAGGLNPLPTPGDLLSGVGTLAGKAASDIGSAFGMATTGTGLEPANAALVAQNPGLQKLDTLGQQVRSGDVAGAVSTVTAPDADQQAFMDAMAGRGPWTMNALQGAAQYGILNVATLGDPEAWGMAGGQAAKSIVSRLAETTGPEAGTTVERVAAGVTPATAVPAALGPDPLGQGQVEALGALGNATRQTGATLAPAVPAAEDASRFYHGTGADFPSPDAARFDQSGLFGPGYYLTDDPRVAGSYGGARTTTLESATQQWQAFKTAAERAGTPPENILTLDQWLADHPPSGAGPNIRAVDVPKNLNLLDVDAPAPAGLIDRVRKQVGLEGAGFDVQDHLDGLPQKPTGQDVWQAINAGGGGERDYPNAVLQELGFDGIRYEGGQRVPLKDSAGAPIEHTAVVVFPESIGKLTNALSGRAGGQATVQFATALGGGAAGGTAGYESAPPGAGPLEVGARTVAGAGLGLGAGLVAPGAIGAVRRYITTPAADAPAMVQGLLNTFDGAVRVGAAQADTLLRQGTVARDAAEQMARNAANTASRDFFAQLRQLGQPDGVVAIRPGVARPAGWTNGADLPARYGLQGYYLAPEVAGVVRNTFGQASDFTRYVLNPIGTVTGAVKETILSGSPFHSLFEELQGGRMLAGAGQNPLPAVGTALQNWWGPAYDAWRLRWAPQYEAAARAGVTLPEARGFAQEVGGLLGGVRGLATRMGIGGAGGAATTYAADKTQGMDDQAALQDALGKGLLGAAFAGAGSMVGPALFQRQVPTLKVMGWDALVRSGMSPEAAATMVNQTFGGLNLTRIARSPDVQAAARAAVFAPDLWEGMARQLGYALSPNLQSQVGNAAKGYVAATVLSGALALEGLNKLFSGHFTNENAPGHELDLDVSRFTKQTSDQGQSQTDYVDILGVLRPFAEVGLGLAHADTSALGKFVMGRASQPVRFGLALAENKTGLGQPIVQPGANPAQAAGQIGGYVVGQEVPAGASSLVQAYQQTGPVGAGIEAITGMRTSAESDIQAALRNPSRNPALKLFADAGVPMPAAPQTLPIGTGGAGIELSPNERKLYETNRFNLLQQTAGPLATNPQFVNAPIEARQRVMQRVLSQADQVAGRQTLAAIAQSSDLRSRVQTRGELRPPVPLSDLTFAGAATARAESRAQAQATRPPIPLTELQPAAAATPTLPARPPLPLADFSDLDPVQQLERRRRQLAGLP